MATTTLIIVLLACVLLEGFFSGSEMAVVNADKLKLASGTSAGSRLALAALHLVKHPARFFSTTLLGTSVATVSASVVATLFIIDRFGPHHAVYALLLWPITLVVGELVPKSLCHYYADRLVLIVSPILFVCSFLFYPIVWLLSQLTDWLLAGLKRRVGREPLLTREELELMLKVDPDMGTSMKPTERRFVSGIFGLAKKRVEAIKTPLVDVVSLPVTATREEAGKLVEEHEFSRVPVYETSVYNIVGVLTGIDLLFGDPRASVRELMHQPYFVPGERRLDRLLARMKQRGEQLAVVVDEYGAATGVVTIEDILEEVVGEIQDEHDVTPTHFEILGLAHYRVSGRMEIQAANDKLHLDIPAGHYETIAGFVLHLAERIPKAGDEFLYKDLHITIHHATDRAVQFVDILIGKPAAG